MKAFCCLFYAFLMFSCLSANDENESEEEESAEEILDEDSIDGEVIQDGLEEDGDFQNAVNKDNGKQYRVKRYVRNLVDNILGGFTPNNQVTNDKNYQNTTQIQNRINILNKDILELQKYLSQYSEIKKGDTEKAARFKLDIQKALERFLGQELSENIETQLKKEKSPTQSSKRNKKSSKNANKPPQKHTQRYKTKNYGKKYNTRSNHDSKVHNIFTVKNVNLPKNYQNSYINKPLSISGESKKSPPEFKIKYYGAQNFTDNTISQAQDIDIKGKKWTIKANAINTNSKIGNSSSVTSDKGYFKKCPTCGK